MEYIFGYIPNILLNSGNEGNSNCFIGNWELIFIISIIYSRFRFYF